MMERPLSGFPPGVVAVCLTPARKVVPAVVFVTQVVCSVGKRKELKL